MTLGPRKLTAKKRGSVGSRIVVALLGILIIFIVLVIRDLKISDPADIGVVQNSANVRAEPAEVRQSADGMANPYQWRSIPAVVDPEKIGLPRAPTVDHSTPYQALLSIPPNIRTEDGGSFEIDKTLYRIAQIQPLPPRMLCTNPSGARWGCGQRGRMALRTLLMNKTLQCLPWKADATPVDLDCQLNSVPLGALIVGAGWAVPADGAPEAIVKAAEKAQADKVGAWASVEGARP